VIARLNMGGPALHVAYLTKGLEQRGYHTTLVAGSLARGENSMSFVAEELGVDIYPIPQLHREISPVYDSLAVWRLVKLIRTATGRTSCTRTRRKPAPSAASQRCSRATPGRRSSCTPSTATSCAATSIRSGRRSSEASSGGSRRSRPG
jgi:hypothetical protein